MLGQFFSNAERERLQRFPSEVAPADLIAFFTLSESDLAQVPVTAAPVKGLSAVVGSAVLAPKCRRRSGGVCDRSAVKVPSAPSVPCPPSIAPH
jgi:hypothetical protein